MNTLEILSEITGWIYVVGWGLFAYPQIYLNYKLKSVEGFKLDYPFLNLFGFAFYSISFSAAYFIKDLPYNNYGLGTVRIHDLVFAYHNFCVNIILNLQAIFYKRGENKISTYSICYIVFAWVSSAAIFYGSEVKNIVPISENFNIIIYLGYLKIVSNFIKYLPLIYWNFVRKSTKGFSIICIMFDMTGASASLTQEFIDYSDGTTPILSPLKVTLGITCLFYDVILMVQHYLLYGDRPPKQSYSKVSPSVKSVTLEGDSTDDMQVNLLVK